MAISKSWIAAAVLCLLVIAASAEEEEEEEKPSFVLTLDAANFSEIVSKHPFIVVEFYAPWCGHCKSLAPEYERAAAVLSTNDPPVVLAKIDASDATNKEVASKYEIQGFPTLKILRNGGESIQEYKGPRVADGIVEFLKKQLGPASKEIKSSEDALSVIDDKKISIVGIFTEFSGKEFETYIKVAEKLRSDYEFSHTSDAKFLPRGDTMIKQPVIRLFKPFDELFVDFKEFDVDAIENFIESASMPLVVTFDDDPSNHPYLSKFFESSNTKGMLFVDFGSEHFSAFKSKLYQLAKDYKVKNISFLIGDLGASEGAFEYFGVKRDQAPLIILQDERKKYFQPNVSPEQIVTWLKDYTDGSLKPYIKSEPIPEVNDEPVKVVVATSVQDVVFNSGKNVLLEFYAPWCGHCKKLAPILDEVAVSFADDADVVIAKMDATINDVPEEFEVHGFPTLYFSSASGKISQYDGNRTAEDIIDFVKSNRDAIVSPKSDDNIRDEL